MKNLRGISKSECVLLENLGEPDFEKRAYPEKLSGNVAKKIDIFGHFSKVRLASDPERARRASLDQRA